MRVPIRGSSSGYHHLFTGLMLACALIIMRAPQSAEAVISEVPRSTEVCFQSAQCAGRYVPVETLIAANLPDTVRSKILAHLADGNVTGAIEYYLLATGAREAPRWLQNLRLAFEAANRVAGRCVDVAQKLHEAFVQLGKNPSYVKVTSTGSELIAFEVQAGAPRSTVQISNNNYHIAVRVGSRIYDAFTGPKGLTEQEYLARLFTPSGEIVLKEVVSP